MIRCGVIYKEACSRILKMKFDNIAILKRENDTWIVERIWELKS